MAARCGERGLAYLSTAHHVSRLNCWVRNGSRCCPTAMAAITTDVENRFHQSRLRPAALMSARPSQELASPILSSPGCLRTQVKSQGPDLNRSVADLQSAAWPLRHLGKAVRKAPIGMGAIPDKAYQVAVCDLGLRLGSALYR